jgi:hypothetical protein
MKTVVADGTPERGVGYKKYEVDVRRCHLRTGETVTPETIIGWHHETSQPVMADLYGQVATIYFNPMHNSLMIMAVSGNN